MALPYALWLVFFVIAPLALIGYQSFFNANGQFSLANYSHYFGMATYIKMTINSIVFAGIITLLTLLVAYPCAYFLTKAEKQSLWILLLILPTWINILLKAYAFIGIFSQSGPVNEFLSFVGIGPQQILFTHTSFIVAAAYIELPFMILPIYNALMAIDPSYEIAARDLGANRWQTLRLVTIPLSMSGVKAGVQAIFIPSLSLFMLTRLIGGNRVITLGTAVEQQFLVAENWGMGSTIGVVLILAMVIFMALSQSKGGSVNGQKKE
ncbi:ABC transporter permease [Atopobacter sp. AH10]|uniref:ABC transporter permease n=1 Tax=Atopobacter sp. AH10 TaxID=2315861 RepID=UPI000EF191F8|nr:ABC transporter permease [Atopobacter sp. AH10]RLK63904.1 ABC transporter permease [Atopobacter sp. AH10]